MSDEMELDEESFFEPIRGMIEGCENFVKKKVSDLQTDLKKDKVTEKKESDNLRKRVQNLEMKDKEIGETIKRVKVLEEERAGLKKRVEVLEQKLTQTGQYMKTVSELEEKVKLKLEEGEAKDTCKCKELFQGFVNVGNAILSGGNVNVITLENTQTNTTNQTSMEQTNMFLSDPVLSTSAIQQPPHTMLDQELSANPSCSTIINQQTQPSLFYSISDQSVITQDETLQPPSDVSFSNLSPPENTPPLSSCSIPIGPKVKVPQMFYSRKSQTPTAYQTIQDVPEDMKQLLQKYHSPKSSMATNEKLTDLQRAYVDYFMDSHKKCTPTEIAKLCIAKGIEDRIWTSSFNPRQGSSFQEYLTQRIKNTIMRKNRLKLKEMLKQQAARLEK